MEDAVPLRQWTNLVRRARLGFHATAVALDLATYADSDGSRVYPGVARLSFDLEISYTTVKRALAKLRDAGLIRKTGRHGDADQYRLIFATDLMDRVEVPSPSQVDLLLDGVRKHKKGTYVPNLRPSSGAAEEGDEDSLRPSTGAADSPITEESAALLGERRLESAALSATICGSPERAATAQDRDTTTTAHSDEDLFGAVTHSRATDREETPEFSAEVTPKRGPCRHGKPRRLNRQGEPRCEPCRTGIEPTTEPDTASETTTAAVVELSPPKCQHGLSAGRRADRTPICAICRVAERKAA